ncbi:MAG: hypothetical protein JXB26_16035, partial [Candidatus Aminicenantes bacterium]|nr:hypothetical protein [Candidatus Aminicenantes bacterium]
LYYSRAKLAADVRRQPVKLCLAPRTGCNKADAVRSARLKGKFGRHFLENGHGKCLITTFL